MFGNSGRKSFTIIQHNHKCRLSYSILFLILMASFTILNALAYYNYTDFRSILNTLKYSTFVPTVPINLKIQNLTILPIPSKEQPNVKFNFEKDTLIFSHIQRTGGTSFDKFLGTNITSDPPCNCFYVKNVGSWRSVSNGRKPRFQCQCRRQANTIGLLNAQRNSSVVPIPSKAFGSWLYTRSTHNWIYCGMHATLPQLRSCVPWLTEAERFIGENIFKPRDGRFIINENNCVKEALNSKINAKACEFQLKTNAIFKWEKFVGISNKNAYLPKTDPNDGRYVLVTKLRDPITRYLSEYEMVRQGATWKYGIYPCGGVLYQPPSCYNGTNWVNVSLNDFMACQSNYAANRMTRHLATVENIGCYDNSLGLTKADYEMRMLTSAKENLENVINYFALVEFPDESNFLMEKMLGIKLILESPSNKSVVDHRQGLSSQVLHKIAEINSLDVQLYQFGLALFWRRYKEYHDNL